MHKSLFIVLAVCLVSVLAGIRKRDAPESENILEKIQATATDFGKKVGDQFSEVFDPENIKEGFNKFVDTVNKAAQEFKPKEEQKQ